MIALLLTSLAVFEPPSPEDPDRFPAAAVADDLDTLASARRAWIAAQAGLHPEAAAEWEARRIDQCWRAECWRCLLRCHWASRDHYYEEPRAGAAQTLEALAELRELIGSEAYYRGAMPSPVDLDALEIH